MLCQKAEKALIFKGVVSGLGKILCVISSFCLLMEKPPIGSDVSFCTFLLKFLEKWILQWGRSLVNVTIYPTYFRVLMRIFLQTQPLLAVAFLVGEKLKIQWNGGTDRKIACHASEKQSKGYLSINICVFSIHSPCSISGQTSRSLRCIADIKNTKNISLASGLN